MTTYNQSVDVTTSLTVNLTTTDRRVTHFGAQVLAEDSAPEYRISHFGAQAMAEDSAPEHRITHIGAQVLVRIKHDHWGWNEGSKAGGWWII